MKLQGITLSFLLFLILELIHRPGVSQLSVILKGCCIQKKTYTAPREVFSAFVQYGKLKQCPLNKLHLTVNKNAYCLDTSEKWVQDVKRCIEQGGDPSCINSLYPTSNKEFSKGGFNEQPPTSAKPQTSTASKDVSTQKAERNEATRSTDLDIYTTPRKRLNMESTDPILNNHDHMQDKKLTTPASPIDISTMSWTVDGHKFTKAAQPDIYTTTIGGISPLPPDSNWNDSDHLHGSDKELPTSTGPLTTLSSNNEVPTQSRNVDRHEPTKAVETYIPTMPSGGLRTPSLDSDPNGEAHLQDNKPPVNENDKKIKEMKTTIITLIGIILLITAVGTGAWCWMRRTDRCNLPCQDKHQGYMSTLTEDSAL